MIETENKIVQETVVECTKEKKKKGHRKVYGIIFVLILFICSIHAFYLLTNSVSATVMIHSIYSADGRNPDGTPFCIMELFNDEVMNSAAEKLDEKLSTQELRSHLTVSDTMTKTSFSHLEQSVLEGENENTYFPTEYLITYSTISEQIRNEGFLEQCKSFWESFQLPKKSEILNAVLQSYQEYYAANYLNYDALFDIDWAAADSMDYYNRYEFMRDTIQRLTRFLQYKDARSISQKENGQNIGYYDMISELSKGTYQNLEKYQAYVTQNGVTNNKEQLLRQFIYMQKLYEEENTRKMHEYEVLREAIDMYDSTTTKVLFIPALDDNKEFYMNRTKVGLDYLTEKADSAKLQANTALYAAKQYAYLQTCFEEQDVEDQIKNTSAQRTHADELYESLKGEIQRLTEDAKILTAEGKELDQEELDISKPFCNVSIVGAGMSSAKRFVLLFMASYVAVSVTKEVFRKKTKKIQEAKS